MSEDPDPEPDIESRLGRLEAQIQLFERIAASEARLVTLRDATVPQPWWRNGKTVTTLVALVAAVVPILTAINGLISSTQQSQRLVVQERNRIRSDYLNRVLKPGVTEADQKRLFGLLAKLKGDPEFQEWASEQLKSSSDRIDELKAQISSLETKNAEFAAQIKKASVSAAERDRLEADLRQRREQVRYWRERVGAAASLLSTENLMVNLYVTSVIPNVKIELRPVGANAYTTATAVTPIVIQNLYRGLYILTASKTGFLTRQIKIDLVTSEATTQAVAITLEPIGKTSGS
ncbi:MAG TPA: hypothetical protein VGS57_15965 [Thermoanaerobaculia bacterium]|jgi:hypothetical protein|nr:hypothetical protein [Thermoanaerobaculia bacterium]